jgi:hypothetical protein
MGRETVYSPNRGKQGGPYKMGPGGNCLCPACGFIKRHESGSPCTGEICPKCGAILVREEVLKVIQSITHK